MAETEKNVVNINGEEYNREDMSARQNYFVEQVRDLQAKRQQAQFQVDQLTAALDFFTKALMESLSDDGEEECAAAPRKKSKRKDKNSIPMEVISCDGVL